MSLAEILTSSAAQHPDNVAVKLDDVEVSYGMLDNATARVATLLRSKGVEVFGVNPQSGEKHTMFRNKFDFPFPLIVDEGRRIAKLYNTDGLIIKRTVYLIGPPTFANATEPISLPIDAQRTPGSRRGRRSSAGPLHRSDARSRRYEVSWRGVRRTAPDRCWRRCREARVR